MLGVVVHPHRVGPAHRLERRRAVRSGRAEARAREHRLDLADLAAFHPDAHAQDDVVGAVLLQDAEEGGLLAARIQEVVLVGALGARRAPEAVVQLQLLAVLGVADVWGQRQAPGVVRHHRRQHLIDRVLQAGAVAIDADRDGVGLGRLGPQDPRGRKAQHGRSRAPDDIAAHINLPGLF